MKKLAILTLGISSLFVSCQSNEETKNQKLAKQAIEIHDEIMPQISNFDKVSVNIDSILMDLNTLKSKNPALDSVLVKTDLKNLQSSIEKATDNMMVWMKDYDATNTDTDYQQKMLDRVTEMKSEFDSVNVQITKIYNPIVPKK